LSFEDIGEVEKENGRKGGRKRRGQITEKLKSIGNICTKGKNRGKA
jgi:hypothetical protein